jgi:hypothetical protein
MAKFNIRQFAKENPAAKAIRRTWLHKAIEANPEVGWQIVDLISEWIASGPIRKDYPGTYLFARLLMKIDCVTAGETTIVKTLQELENGQTELPRK